MSKCDIHNVPYEIQELREYPGKTHEICPRCEEERKKRIFEMFEKPIISTAHERDIHMSAMNPPKPKMFKTTVSGVGPYCIEFDDGEIICTRSEERQKQIAERVR